MAVFFATCMKKPGRKDEELIRGSTKALDFCRNGGRLLELACLPEPVRLFSEPQRDLTMRDKTRLVNYDVRCLFFPFIYYSGLLQILYSLSKMGYGNDERLDGAWELLEKKKLTNGRYPLERTPTQSPWKVGEVARKISGSRSMLIWQRNTGKRHPDITRYI